MEMIDIGKDNGIKINNQVKVNIAMMEEYKQVYGIKGIEVI